MSQAIMLHDKVDLRSILRALGPHVEIQDAQREREGAMDLLGRLDADAAEDVRDIPQLFVAGIDRNGYLVFLKTLVEQSKGRPIWINLTVPPPDRFQIVAYDPPAIAAQLAELIDTP